MCLGAQQPCSRFSKTCGETRLATEELLQEPNKTITIRGANVTVALEGRGKALTQGMVLKWSFSVPILIVAAELVDFEDGSDSAQLVCSKFSRQRSADSTFLNATISETAFDWRNWTSAGYNDYVLEAHTPFGVDAIVVEPAMARVPQSSAVVQLDAEGLEPWAEGVIIATALLLVLAGVAVAVWLVLKRRRAHSDGATASTSVEAETLPRVAQPTGQYGAFPQPGEAQSLHYDHVLPISTVQYDQVQPELVASQYQYQSIRPIQPRYENPRTAN
jgi:hypothetical protein